MSNFKVDEAVLAKDDQRCPHIVPRQYNL